MAGNTIIITGRLATQPETKDRGHGPMTRARLAHSQGHYDKQSRQWVAADTDTAWFTIMANGKTGETLATMNKGDKALVVGSFSVDEWAPRDGTHSTPGPKQTDLRIWASSVAIVPRKQQASAAGYAPAAAAPTYPAAPAPQAAAMPAAEPWENYTDLDF